MTSFPIFVAVRVMPSTLADPGENVVVKSPTEITIKAPMEGTASRTVNHAFGPTASFYDLWDNYGQKALDAAQKGEHAAIVVYGGTGSGKSFTTSRNPNKEDLVQQTIERLAGNADANLTIVAVRNDQIVDLINPKLDNLKLKGDESTGPIVEGATVVRLPTSVAGAEHVARCMAARDDLCATVNTLPQMLFTLYLFSVGPGSIVIVECPSTHRTVAPRLTPDQQKESIWRLKAVDQLTRVWLDIAVTADPKAIAWKDNKPLRTLTAAGTQAMEGNKGFLGLVVCAGAGKHALYESMCNVIIAEGAVKLEGLKTVSEYKEAISAYEERAEADAKVAPGLQADAKAAEAEYERVRQENEAKAKELEEKVAHLKSLAPLAKAQADQDIERAKKDAERMKADHVKALAQEMDKLKNITTNSSGLVESESKQKIALVDAEFAAKAKAIKDEMAEIEKETEGYRAILKEADALRAESRRKEQEALKPVKDMERDLAKLKKELDLTVATRGKCREDGMAEDDIERMIPVWELRDKLDGEDDALTEVAREVMQLDFTFTRKLGAPTPDTSDASSDSDSDSTSSDSSTDSEELAERARQEQEAKDRAAREKQAKFDRADFEKEFAFVKDAVHKEKYLSDLVDKVFAYLEYGTNVSVLTPRGFTRHFFYLTRNRKQVAIVNEVSEGQTPIKKDPARVLPIDTVKSIVMGQHSALYKNFLAKVAGRPDPVRAEPPPPPEDLATANMHRYYYRSFSLQPKNDADDWFDIVCDTQTDFEAIIIAVAKLTDLDANWGRGLFIDLADRVDDLKSFERKFCEELHLTPKEYFTIKQKTVENSEMLYMTLHDMRLATSMDLYHCQRIMDVFYTQKWVLRRNLKYFRHQEAVEARADAAAQRIGGSAAAAAPAGGGLSLL